MSDYGIYTTAVFGVFMACFSRDHSRLGQDHVESLPKKHLRGIVMQDNDIHDVHICMLLICL